MVTVFSGIKQPLEYYKRLFVQVWELVLSKGTKHITKKHGFYYKSGRWYPAVIGVWAQQSGISDWDLKKY